MNIHQEDLSENLTVLTLKFLWPNAIILSTLNIKTYLSPFPLLSLSFSVLLLAQIDLSMSICIKLFVPKKRLKPNLVNTTTMDHVVFEVFEKYARKANFLDSSEESPSCPGYL